MNEHEWADFALWLHGGFGAGQPFDQVAQAAYKLELGALPQDEAMAAVRLAASRSARPDFRPSAVACGIAARGAKPAESFDEGWRLMLEGWKASGKRTDDEACRIIAEGLVRRGQPAMARMLSSRGLVALLAERVDDPEDGGKVRGRLGKLHDMIAEGIADGERAVLSSGPALPGGKMRGLDVARVVELARGGDRDAA